MLWYYQLALDGTLYSATEGAAIDGLTVTNELFFPVQVWWLDSQGQRWPWAALPAINGSYTQNSPPWPAPAQAGTWFLVTSTLTGSFVCAFQAQEGNASYTIAASMLCDPNDIGTFPEPTGGIIVPPDSPRVLVGFGFANSCLVVREQYWERMSDSYCLARNEVQEFSTITTEGSQSTASSQTDVSTSLGLSGSAGWGPVSATVSAALSTQSSTMQQVTVTAETTAYASDTLTNSRDETVMYLRWQLTDVVTLFSMPSPSTPYNVPLGSVITGENPVLTGGPYEMAHLT